MEIESIMTCPCTRCYHETVLECETASCSCCPRSDHDINVVKDERNGGNEDC